MLCSVPRKTLRTFMWGQSSLPGDKSVINLTKRVQRYNVCDFGGDFCSVITPFTILSFRFPQPEEKISQTPLYEQTLFPPALKGTIPLRRGRLAFFCGLQGELRDTHTTKPGCGTRRWHLRGCL